MLKEDKQALLEAGISLDIIEFLEGKKDVVSFQEKNDVSSVLLGILGPNGAFARDPALHEKIRMLSVVGRINYMDSKSFYSE